MDARLSQEGITDHRLTPARIAENFSDLHPPLDHHEALVESDRCYFCYDAPCMQACPTSIDIPLFIRQISTGNEIGAAKTIFDQNIMGGMCARVCPTETLCEEVCVREVAEGKPVKIGQLQRYATDAAMRQDKQFYHRAPSTGKRIAVVGAGPAGLAAAHRLSMHGHSVTIFEARPKPGGLNEYGIAAYKSTNNFAQAEVDYVLGIGGIEILNERMLGRDFSLSELSGDFDAVFLGMGLSGVNALRTEGEDAQGTENAVDFISRLRQSETKDDIKVGRRVVVIGGGMTAVDAAVQSKLLGAEEVTIAYRRGKEQMNASEYEQDLATSNGVVIRHWVQPRRIVARDGRVTAIELEHTGIEGDRLVGTGETLIIEADQVFRAIGQSFVKDVLNGSGQSTAFEGGKIRTDEEGHTSLSNVWAGGDCVAAGEDLTVSATAQGRDAAESIHRHLMETASVASSDLELA